MPDTLCCANPDCNCEDVKLLSRNHPKPDFTDDIDWGDDDTPLACGIENPETCEACT